MIIKQEKRRETRDWILDSSIECGVDRTYAVPKHSNLKDLLY